MPNVAYRIAGGLVSLFALLATPLAVGFLARNERWDAYHAGFVDGVAEGVDRALQISESEAAEMSENLLEAEVAGTPSEGKEKND